MILLYLYHLTGCFPIRYAMDEMKYKDMIHNGSMWKQLLKWHQQGNFLCAASKPGSDQDKNAQGIRYGHAYSILRVIEIQGNKLLQLRNPWGSGEWTGDWSDKSSKWTPKLIEALKVQDEEDGIFWMCFNDFINNFRTIYGAIKLNDLTPHKIDGVLQPGEYDGAGPFANYPFDDLCLPQWIKRCNSNVSSTKLFCICEKTGGCSDISITLVFQKGDKIKSITGGSQFENFMIHGSSSLTSFEFDYNQTHEPIHLLIFRKKFAEPTNWHLEIFCEDDLEITKLE